MQLVIGSNINAKGMFISIILMVLLLATSCSDQTDCCTIIDTDVSILYLSQDGEHLLETDPDHHPDKIKIYYKQQDGSYTRAVNFLLDAPNMFRVIRTQEGPLLNVYTSDVYIDDLSWTIIEFNDLLRDTLKCQYAINDNSAICTDVWANGVKQTSRSFQIIH